MNSLLKKKTIIMVMCFFSYVMMIDTADCGTYEEQVQVCHDWAEISTFIMKQRQKNIPIGNVITFINKNGDSETNSTALALVEQAYKYERHRTAKLQKQAIEEFRESSLIACIKTIK